MYIKKIVAQNYNNFLNAPNFYPMLFHHSEKNCYLCKRNA